jgi:5-methylcytosine-specific restriction protein A
MPNLTRGKKPKYLANVSSKRKESPDAKFYKSKAWKSVRLLKIAENPICEVCYHVGKLTDATFGSPIDHAVRLEDGGAALDLANLITMCPQCHNTKSAMEASGYRMPGNGVEGAKVPNYGEKEKLFNRIAELRSTKFRQ